jgi:hypothetical protein
MIRKQERSDNMECMSNCDLRDVLRPEDKQGEKIVYGKKMLTSHRLYDLWNEENDTFNINKIEHFYEIFIKNMHQLQNVFEARWVKPHEILPTSKGLIWDWTSEEEKMRNVEDIRKHGVYFPILTLDRGLLHNQIMSDEEKEALRAKMLYNTYNGNHRADCMQYLVDSGIWSDYKNVIIYIIPPFCQKSCTGFKYDIIDDMVESSLTQQKLKQPINLFHLDKVEHEMKVVNWRNRIEVEDGVSVVGVDNYNVAFRILTEWQNVLEPVLVRYFELHQELPSKITHLSRVFNNEKEWYKAFGDTPVTSYINEINERIRITKNIYISYTDANAIAIK